METASPEANYLTRQNIRYPGTQAQATAAEAKARTDIAARHNLTSVSGGVVKKFDSANNDPTAS